MDAIKFLSTYTAFLRALYLIHQNSHWCVKGHNFYSNHVLFQRLYESAQANADKAAEKVIGLFGNDSINIVDQASDIKKFMSRYVDKNPIVNSLNAERDFLKASQKLYNLLQDSDALTLGLDDMITAICSDREEAVYLLQQVLS